MRWRPARRFRPIFASPLETAEDTGSLHGGDRDDGRSLGWSALYLIVSRLSALIAVPLVLSSVGADLYAIWVLAGVLVMSQGLVDLGFGTALIRFTAMGAAQGSRSSVGVVLRRSFVFYLGLSAVVGVPLWIGSQAIAQALPYIQGSEVDQAGALFRYAAIAFGLTNMTMLCAAALQGLDHVDQAFRGQTLGWLLYIPALGCGLALGGNVNAIGLAWMLAYSSQIVLLLISLYRGLAAVGKRAARPPSLRSMLAVGGTWQVSSWADFATFQLPRILGGAVLSSSALIGVDLALRLGQAVTMPIFAALPLVLPRATADWARSGMQGLATLVTRYANPATILVVVGAGVAIPLGPPAIATWTGRPVSPQDPLVVAAVLIGVIAHASTGLLSSVLLAAGRLRPVLVYKYRQLLLALLLILGIGWIGELELAIALGVSLAVPALMFNRAALGILAVRLLDSARWRTLILGTLALTTAVGISEVGGRAIGLPWPIVLVASATLAVPLAALLLGTLGLSWPRPAKSRSAADRAPSPPLVASRLRRPRAE